MSTKIIEPIGLQNKETCCFEFFEKGAKILCGKPAAYFTKIKGKKVFLCEECALKLCHFELDKLDRGL